MVHFSGPDGFWRFGNKMPCFPSRWCHDFYCAMSILRFDTLAASMISVIHSGQSTRLLRPNDVERDRFLLFPLRLSLLRLALFVGIF